MCFSSACLSVLMTHYYWSGCQPFFSLQILIWMWPSPSSTVHLLEWPRNHQTTDLLPLYLSGVVLQGPPALLGTTGALLVGMAVLWLALRRLSVVATCFHMMLGITPVLSLMMLGILEWQLRKWISLVSCYGCTVSSLELSELMTTFDFLQVLGYMQSPVSILTTYLCPITLPLCGLHTMPLHTTTSTACPMHRIHLPM